MALMKCPECGRLVSDKAAACPYCRTPFAIIAKANKPTIAADAVQLYEHCITNGYGRGVTRNWAIKHFQVLVDALTATEKIKIAFCICRYGQADYYGSENDVWREPAIGSAGPSK